MATLGLDASVHQVSHLVREKMKLNAVVVRCAPPDGQRDVFGPDVNSWHPREAAWG